MNKIDLNSLKEIRWSLVWYSFSLKERLLIYFFGGVVFISLVLLGAQFYYINTQEVPARGGTIQEASVGTPRFINPTLAQISDIDRDITRLIYPGLMEYDKGGKLIEGLAQSYTLENDTLYTFKLRENILWHDGEALTADDVVFTIKLIQDPKYASPIRANWQGVEAKSIDDLTVSLKLTSPYSPFLENATVGILPKHIWENISPKSFPLADENLQPVGSGPYKFEKFQKDNEGNIRSYTLTANEQYYKGPPYIQRIVFRFFENGDSALASMKRHEIDAMSFVSGHNSVVLEEVGDVNVYTFSLPRYFAIFFNQAKSKSLSQREVRAALSLATNREEIIDIAAAGKGSPAYGPIIRELLGYNPQIEEKYEFSIEEAKGLLDENNWLDKDGDGIREKKLSGDEEPTPLEINLITIGWQNFTELDKVVSILADQWGKVGIKVNTSVYPPGEIQQDFIRPREYEALVFGQVVGIDPDPFSFWHSSQKKDPGLNLALYENRTVDRLLEEARQTFDSGSRAAKYVQLQNIITDEIPAIFLYSPTYLYPMHKKIKGVSEGKIADPSWRFADVNEWYINTKRVWK